jgi:hypothetical protein
MKNKKIIILLIVFLSVSNVVYAQCKLKEYLPEKYYDSYKAYGEELYLLTREYYDRFFKYPKSTDKLLKFEYTYTMQIIDNLYADSTELINMVNSAFNTKHTQAERENMSFGLAFCNFLSMYKDYITLKSDTGYVSISCDVDNRNLFNIKKELVTKCYDRYDRWSEVLNNCIFFNIDDNTIKDNDFKNKVLRDIKLNVMTKYNKACYVINNNKEYFKIVILRYNKQEGLTFLCPDDNNLDSDPFINDVKSFLTDLLDKNPDIYEIVIPVICMESKKTNKFGIAN